MQHKAKIAWTIGVFLIGLLGFIGVKSMQVLNQKKVFAQHKNQLPDLSVCFTKDSLTYRQQPYNKTIIIFFGSSCDHCQRQANAIYKQQKAFINTQIYMVSTETLANITRFGKHYQLDKLPNVILLQLPKEQLFQIFGSVSVPHIFVYDAQQRLSREFKGETPTDSLINAINL